MPWVSGKLNQKIVLPAFRNQLNHIEKEDPKRIEAIELFSPHSDKETRLILAIILSQQLCDVLEEKSKQEGKTVEGLGHTFDYEHAQLFGSTKKYYCANIVQVNDEMTGNVKVRVLSIDKVYNEDNDRWYHFDDNIQFQLIDAEMPFIMDIRVDSFKKHQMKITKKDGNVGQRLSTVGKYISKSFL